MLEGIKQSSDAMLSLQANLETVANNIANANTAGFKQDVGVTFSAVYNSAMANAGFLQAGGAESMGDDLGYATMVNFKTGALKKTDNPSHLAIVDDKGVNFFTLKSEDGILFTRNGEFRFNSEGYLTTKEGLKVMGQHGAIKINSPNFKIDKDGVVFVDEKEVDKILITSFKDVKYLKKIGNNNFQAYDAAGAHVANKYGIAQGYIETSNVNALKEMVEMMQIMRTYEANQKMLQNADQSLSKTVNEVGRVRG